MSLTFLIELFLLLIALLGLLVTVLIVRNRLKKKKEKRVEKVSSANLYTLEELEKILEKENSATKELHEAMQLIIQDYGTIGNNAPIYMNILYHLCRHHHITSKMIISFSQSLEKLNHDYKNEINDAVMQGLNSRNM